MQHTPEQERAFKEAYAIRHRRQILLVVPVVVLMVAMIVGNDKRTGTVFGIPLASFGPVFILFIIGARLFSLKNWRCPACNRYLGKVWNPRHCPACGIALK